MNCRRIADHLAGNMSRGGTTWILPGRATMSGPTFGGSITLVEIESVYLRAWQAEVAVAAHALKEWTPPVHSPSDEEKQRHRPYRQRRDA
jgi:hypothetical protein